ncbi:MAG: DUF2635 domain-containing protein [Proteobacteria bacterium]|nr:DUF2635 domain-containing protein [Pseudomonadota bacterium]
MIKTYVKPTEGRRVLNPATRQPLPAEGASVEKSSYWLRRIAAGEVVETKPPSAAKKKED